MAKILFVEDDLALANSLKDFFASQNYTVDHTEDGMTALEFLKSLEYDLIILDRHLPLLDGLTICQQFRQAGGRTPILMLTGMDTIDDKEEGLDSGADDYLCKPFNVRELGARIRTLLRRPTELSSEILNVAGIRLDTIKRRVTKDGLEIRLQPNELSVLEFFMRHPNQVISAESLFKRVWSTDSVANLESVYSCLTRLRRKLNADDKEAIIRTEHGYGYRLVVDADN